MAARPDRAPPGDPLTPRVVRVLKRRRDAPRTVTLDIAADDATAFQPGQFNMLTAFGVGEVPISLSGDPADTNRRVHTIRAVGPVSSALARLAPGDALGLRGPFGSGWPMAAAHGHDVVLIAGGLGLAPLRPALYRLLAERQRYGTIALLYGTRSPDEILFRRELAAWQRRHDIRIGVTVDHAPSDWTGHVGVVTRLIPGLALDPANTLAFVCGPEVMMRFTIAALKEAGLGDAAIHLSLERNMKCAVGLCGHCQFGPVFVCRDGPVLCHDRLGGLLGLKEL
ncbi:FAD/NAD(P)-binding protein [Modicisalibacter tunisiensis]|uniref:FAD/NAD(P)-binding protein n=1 Tax=Modicisalibacter tunisiensis TaxID=390637 RepID=A0ABS7X0E2_9GAMM|nr:FAD/NAD(P)-binding protein [Modicisalibacter tunisiensis]MBZ9538236.1 FAD/NAD(P)-binding protein [Modicisalibacter tunisiensis]MBZ9568352.1 FAD/NAD(P)-binding protein [Modicisalibacter tunisiensis]